jgi:hypothetical protein
VKGTFTARYGPDNTYIDSFTLTANDERGVPQMLNQALVRLDGIYAGALNRGVLQPDPTLVTEQHAFYAALSRIQAAADALAATRAPLPTVAPVPTATASQAVPTQAATATYTVQFVSPDARAVDGALAAVRGVSGVRGAATTSIAIGGTSVMRVTMAGDIDALAAALRARGWQVTVGSNALSIRR